jgi:RNA polymerase primary sigma factor
VLLVWGLGFRFWWSAWVWFGVGFVGGIADRGRSIRLPVNVAQQERKVVSAERALTTKLGRAPTREEVAEAAKLSAAQVQALDDAARTVTSLDTPVGGEQDTALGALIPAEGVSVDERVHLNLAEDVVRRIVEELPETEREVIKLRYGLDGDREPMPMTQTGRRLGLSADRVRRIEEEALARLARRRELAGLAEAA